jgi:protein-tyrosine-phosphatase
MAIQSRFTPVLAVIGVLALGGASTARAQDTSAAARSDTSGYRGYQNRTDTMGSDTTQAGQRNAKTDSAGMKYTGPATDTALKAKPGAQTGPSAGDTGKAARKAAAGTADTVVCMDGSNAAKSKKACKSHGGIDRAATRAALKARGGTAGQPAESTTAPMDTTQRNKTSAGYHDTGAPSDTALKAKPGTQTGPDTGAAGRSDTSSSNR